MTIHSDIDNLRFYKLSSDVHSPVFATPGSACFDIFAYIPKGTIIKVHSNYEREVCVREEMFRIESNTRVMIPTGLIFDIQKGWSVRLHARSGLVLNQGLTLANGEGIIDSDYVKPVFIIMQNISANIKIINNGDRICQGEMVMDHHYYLEEIKEKPTQKTDRDGGFGSTGTK